ATAVAATTATTALLSPPPCSSPVTELVAAALLSCLDVPVWRSSLSQRTATSAPRTQRRGCKGTGPTSWSGPSVQSQPSPGTLAFPPSHGAGCPPRGASDACGGHGVAAWFKGMPWLLPMLSVWTGQIQRWVHDCDIILRGRKTTVAFTVLGCAARLICIVLMCYFQVATSSARMGQAEF
uniref:Uncharacterized protein n=1 Tax=Triticum urartu TaxID=4572 RepID=A0A8R7Q322_TRIUA